MILNSKQLIGLKVDTENGQNIGKVNDFIIDTDNLRIKQIIVSKSKIIHKVMVKELLIDISQIIEITSERVVVSDGVIKLSQTIKQTVSA